MMKEILLGGEIGRVVSVDFSWYLDVIHGADYFRRWHRLREIKDVYRKNIREKKKLEKDRNKFKNLLKYSTT